MTSDEVGGRVVVDEGEEGGVVGGAGCGGGFGLIWGCWRGS